MYLCSFASGHVLVSGAATLFKIDEYINGPPPSADPAKGQYRTQLNHIQCSSGVVTEVHFSSYGRPVMPRYLRGPLGKRRWWGRRRRIRYRLLGNKGPRISNRCHAKNTFDIVRSMCYGKPACNIRVSNDVFGDPCKGRTKYLAVQVRCGSPEELIIVQLPLPETFMPYKAQILSAISPTKDIDGL